MKKTILTLTLITLLSNQCFTQKHEANLNIKTGTAQRNYTTSQPNKFNTQISNELYNANDKCLELNYKYNLFSKYNIFIGIGAELGQARYYYLIYTPSNFKTYLHSIKIKNSRINLNLLSLNKQFHFFNENLILDVGISWSKPFFLNKKITYKTNGFQNSSRNEYLNAKYNYNFEINNTFYSNEQNINKFQLNNNINYSLSIKTKINKQLFLNFGFNYLSKLVFFYNYNIEIIYYNDNNQPIKNYILTGYKNSENNYRFVIKDNFLYLKFGLSYKF